MRREKEKKNLKSKHIFLKVVLVGIACYFVYSIFSTQIDIANKKSELSGLQAKTEELKVSNAEYQSLLDSCDTDGYIERLAREKLNYVYPNERVYIDRSGK